MLMSELATVAMMRDDFEAAEQWLVDARRYADEVPFASPRGMVRNAGGRLARLRGDLDEALRLHGEAVDLYQQDQTHGGLAYLHSCAGFTEELMGNLDAARSHHHAALEHARKTGDEFAVALALEGMGATLIAGGDLAQGVELVSAGLAAREEAGAPLPSGESLDVDRALKTAAAGLTVAALEKAIAAGRNLGIDAAVEMVLAD